MAATVTDTDIGGVLAEVYKGFRRNLFPQSPMLSNRWWEPERVRSYAYYGFWRCPRCKRHVEGYERKGHEALHVLRGDGGPPDVTFVVTMPVFWDVKTGRGVISGTT